MVHFNFGLTLISNFSFVFVLIGTQEGTPFLMFNFLRMPIFKDNAAIKLYNSQPHQKQTGQRQTTLLKT